MKGLLALLIGLSSAFALTGTRVAVRWYPLALWSGSLPRGLFCREWNLLNVMSHGFPSPEAEVAVRLGGVGFTVRIR